MLSKHEDPVNSISFDPEGDFLVSGALDGVINVWSIQVGELDFELLKLPNVGYGYTRHKRNLRVRKRNQVMRDISVNFAVKGLTFNFSFICYF